MSPALKYWDGSAWKTLPTVGLPGPAGRNPSCKAQSPITYAAADGYFRGYSVNYTTVNWDDFGNSFVPASAWTCRAAGRYLMIATITNANQGEVGIALGNKYVAGIARTGPDSNKWGMESVWVADYNVGDTLTYAGYNTGGGSATFTLEAIQLDGVSGWVGPPALVSALPTSPVDGQEVYYLADATNGIVWHLRYRAAAPGSYKWEFLGGSDIEHAITSQTTVTGSGWVDSGGPQITLPFAGDYEISFGVQFNAVPSFPYMWAAGVSFGGIAPSDPYIVQLGGPVSSATIVSDLWKTVNKTGITAGAIAKILYTYVNYSQNIKNRVIRARPIRVG